MSPRGLRNRHIERLEPRTFFAIAGSAEPAFPLPFSPGYDLAARGFRPTGVVASDYLDEIESVVRGIVRYQDSSGRIIDPDAGREVQYSTPYFAFAVATLLSAGRAADLAPQGLLAMDAAAQTLAGGRAAQPDDHGEFYLAPLAKAIDLYAPHVSPERLALWRQELSIPRDLVLHGLDHNWRTYAMKGEWARAKAGLVDTNDVRAWIEQSWIETQRSRFLDSDLGLYHDRKTDPETYAYDAAARGNLLALVLDGYDGPSRAEIEACVTRGTIGSLYLQEPNGASPAGGRSGDHVWNDVVNGLNFERMAGVALAGGDAELAGQFRRASALALQSIRPFKRADGTYAVTKNSFDPAERVGFGTYSFLTNYNGYVMYHLAETYLARTEQAAAGDIAERPAPAETGGFAVSTDPAFSGVFANAGGMLVQSALRGETQAQFGQYWTTLGVTRFGRAGWDARLGPGDGTRDVLSGQGVSFAPTFLEDGQWQRLASMPDRYQGTAHIEFQSPVLVRFSIDYSPLSGLAGPTFRDDFVITPDGVLSTVTSSAAPGTFGVTWPLLINDGSGTVRSNVTAHGASAAFNEAADEQHFLALQATTQVTQTDAAVRGASGDLLPVRAVATAPANQTFIYPRSSDDPSAEDVRTSYGQTSDGFSTLLGRVEGDVYIGRAIAGGVAQSVDLNADGAADLTFPATTGFVLTLRPDGSPDRLETDRAVVATVGNRQFSMQAHVPLEVSPATTPTPAPSPPPPTPADLPHPSNAKPTANLLSAATTFRPGRPLKFRGAGSDPEDGLLHSPALRWSAELHLLDQVEPVALRRLSGQRTSFRAAKRLAAPDAFYRVTLTATDSIGQATSATADVYPQTADVELRTNIPNLQLRIDGVTLPAPATVQWAIGTTHTIDATEVQTVLGNDYRFTRWSKGKGHTLDVTAARPLVLTAHYVAIGGGASASSAG